MGPLDGWRVAPSNDEHKMESDIFSTHMHATAAPTLRTSPTKYICIFYFNKCCGVETAAAVKTQHFKFSVNAIYAMDFTTGGSSSKTIVFEEDPTRDLLYYYTSINHKGVGWWDLQKSASRRFLKGAKLGEL